MGGFCFSFHWQNLMVCENIEQFCSAEKSLVAIYPEKNSFDDVVKGCKIKVHDKSFIEEKKTLEDLFEEKGKE